MIGASVFLVILFYSVGYWQSAERPSTSGEHPSPGWTLWWDQGNYYRSLNALEKDVYNPSEHLFPIGYALFGMLFYPLMPAQPFFLLDLACYIATGAAFICICFRFLPPEESLLLCFLCSDLAHRGQDQSNQALEQYAGECRPTSGLSR